MLKHFVTKSGERNKAIAKKVVAARDNQEQSWKAIAAELGVSPRTVRRLYDEAQGEGAHFESRLPGKGGRTRQVEQPAEAEA